jgi:hypothetical protein
MAYAVIIDPDAVDSPNVPTYQPHVYGRLDPPSLIPLQMREVDLRIDVTVTHAEVTLCVRWWVHSITQSRVEQHLLCTTFFLSPVLRACRRLLECLCHR